LKIVLFGSPIKNQKKNVSKTIKKRERQAWTYTAQIQREKNVESVFWAHITRP
jgi:hypothetical protein